MKSAQRPRIRYGLCTLDLSINFLPNFFFYFLNLCSSCDVTRIETQLLDN